jgi:hypothetical protein
VRKLAVVVNAKVFGKVRRETINGAEYFIAPVTMIVEGVLPGSAGPLMYPRDELIQNVTDWYQVPVLVYHPFDARGNAVAARGNTAVLNRQGIGHIEFPRVVIHGGRAKLKAIAYFDAEKTRRVDKRVYNALERNRPMELSTGLFTMNEPASGSYLGRQYVGIARNYFADHVAILPDMKGACDLEMGCGLLVNDEFGHWAFGAGKRNFDYATIGARVQRHAKSGFKGATMKKKKKAELHLCTKCRQSTVMNDDEDDRDEDDEPVMDGGSPTNNGVPSIPISMLEFGDHAEGPLSLSDFLMNADRVITDARPNRSTGSNRGGTYGGGSEDGYLGDPLREHDPRLFDHPRARRSADALEKPGDSDPSGTGDDFIDVSALPLGSHPQMGQTKETGDEGNYTSGRTDTSSWDQDDVDRENYKRLQLDPVDERWRHDPDEAKWASMGLGRPPM